MKEFVTAATAFGLALVLASRASMGPLETPFGTLDSPVGMATVLFFVLALLVIQRIVRSPVSVQQTEAQNFPAWAIWALLICGAVLFLSATGDPFVSDDYILVGPTAAGGGQWVQGGGDGSYRPLGQTYFQIAFWAAGTDPRGWRLASLLLHVLNSVILAIVCKRLWPNRLALGFIAPALFFLHGSRPEPVFWTAASFDLLACFFCLGALLSWITLRKQHEILSIGFVLTLASAAIVSKESAYAIPFVGCILYLSDQSEYRKTAWKFIAVVTAVCGVLMGYRLWLLGGPGGYVDPISGEPQVLSIGLLSTVKAFSARIWEVLVLPINWESGPSVLLGLGILVCTLSFLHSAGDKCPFPRRVLLLLVGLTAACAAPAVHLLLIGSPLLGVRVLYLPSIPFCILVAMLFSGTGRFSHLAAVGVLAGNLVFLSHNLDAWRSAAQAADRFCEAAVGGDVDPSEAPHEQRGVYVLANGAEECVALKIKQRAR